MQPFSSKNCQFVLFFFQLGINHFISYVKRRYKKGWDTLQENRQSDKKEDETLTGRKRHQYQELWELARCIVFQMRIGNLQEQWCSLCIQDNKSNYSQISRHDSYSELPNPKFISFFRLCLAFWAGIFGNMGGGKGSKKYISTGTTIKS